VIDVAAVAAERWVVEKFVISKQLVAIISAEEMICCCSCYD
jgi:hypothetical protein